MENFEIQEQVKKELDKLNFSSYRDFNYLPYGDIEKKEEMLESFRNNLKSEITEVLVLDIYDNVGGESERRKNLHPEIQRFIDFAEGHLKYYILKTNEDIYGVFIGCNGGSTPRANEYYMQQFLKNPEVKQKTKILKAKTSDFLEE